VGLAGLGLGENAKILISEDGGKCAIRNACGEGSVKSGVGDLVHTL